MRVTSIARILAVRMLGRQHHQLRSGDCLAMQLDRPTMFHNPTREPARYAVVIATESPTRT